MTTCKHNMEHHQFWDECTKCGARWSDERGWYDLLMRPQSIASSVAQTKSREVNQLGKLRQKAGLSVAEFCRRANVSRRTIEDMEHNPVVRPISVAAYRWILRQELGTEEDNLIDLKPRTDAEEVQVLWDTLEAIIPDLRRHYRNKR